MLCGRMLGKIVLVRQVQQAERLTCGRDIGAFIPHEVDRIWQCVVYLHAIKHAALITDGDRDALDGF